MKVLNKCCWEVVGVLCEILIQRCDLKWTGSQDRCEALIGFN